MMLRRLLNTSLWIFICISGSTSHAVEKISLWGDETMPYAIDHSIEEYEDIAWGTRVVYQVTEPTITLYPAIGENSGIAVLILPGGGYALEAIYHEGQDVAKRLASAGINAAVLKYRLPNPQTASKPELVAISDVRKALSWLHQHSSRYGVNPNKIGVMGFSAGSHLATVASVWPANNPQQQPDFSALIYGVTRLTTDNQSWLENSLYHRPMTSTEIKQQTLLAQVKPTTPPAFLVHSYDDDVCDVAESIDYAEQLRSNQVDVELHLYQKGGHGYGLGKKEDGTHTWSTLFVNWVKQL